MISGQRDPKRCIALSLALTGDLEKIAPTGVTPPFATLISNNTGSHVVDKLLECTTPSIFHRYHEMRRSTRDLKPRSIYIAFFRGKLSDFALHPRANFTVSALLSRVSSRLVTVIVFSCRLTDVVSSLTLWRQSWYRWSRTFWPKTTVWMTQNIQHSHCAAVNVVKNLIEVAARLSVHQKQVLTVCALAWHLPCPAQLQGLLSAFHMARPEDYTHSARLILGMLTLDKYEEQLKEEQAKNAEVSMACWLSFPSQTPHQGGHSSRLHTPGLPADAGLQGMSRITQ